MFSLSPRVHPRAVGCEAHRSPQVLAHTTLLCMLLLTRSVSVPVVRGERAAVERAQEDGPFTARKAFHKGFKEQGTHSPRHGGDARRAFGACKNTPSRFFWSGHEA